MSGSFQWPGAGELGESSLRADDVVDALQSASMSPVVRQRLAPTEGPTPRLSQPYWQSE